MRGNPSTRINNCTKLFVAGVPTGIDPRHVLNFFSNFGKFTICDSSYQAEVSGKGYCNLLCFSKKAVQRVTSQRYFSFMGRTLSVTVHKSGLGLLIENKKTHARRVIFKKVPNYISEEFFINEISSRYGRLQSIFQFKQSMDMKAQRLSSNMKFKVFSAVFEEKSVAKFILNQRCVNLANGITILAEPFQKRLKTSEAQKSKKQEDGLPQHHNSYQFKHEEKKDSNKIETRHSGLHDTERWITHCFVKPTSRKYHSMKEDTSLESKVQDIASNPDLENYRFNLKRWIPN